MKNKIIMLISLMSVAAFIVSCSDDDNGTEPEDKEDVVYFDGSVEAYVYDEYDLDTDNSKIANTVHQDSLAYSQETQKDGKSASEYSVFTNAEGSYMSDGMNYYSGETNKMYAHISVFQNMFGNIEAEGFSLETFFDQIDTWFLIADNKSNSWEIYDGQVTFDLPELGETDGNVLITMKSDGNDAVTIDGESMMADKYTMTMNIKAMITVLIELEVDIDVTSSFWVAPNIGLVKSSVNSFKLPVIDLWVEGTESMLVRYNKTNDDI